MFGMKSPLYIVYVRRKRHDLYDEKLTPDAESTTSHGLYGLRYQPHHLIAGVFDNLGEAATYANRLLGYRKQFGVPGNVFSKVALPDSVVEYRWPTGRHEFEAIGIMEVVKRGGGRPHQPTVDEREASELVDSVEMPNAPLPMMLTQEKRADIVLGAPINRDWIMRDGVDWVKPLDADAKQSVARTMKRQTS
jgi:hypothetical protein